MTNSVLKIKSKLKEVIHICEIQEKDAWSICDFAVSNENRLQQFFPKTLEQNLNPELSRIFTQLKYKQFKNKEEYLFTLKGEHSKKVVGLIYIKELNKLEGQGEFAYCIDYNYQGHGIVSKAVSELTNYAFEYLNLNRLQIIVHKTNLASLKVAENCSFTWQKTLPKEYKEMDMELYERFKN
ncbi:MAG: GNAT family N-acetyltransferase [Bacteroidetes bacterium MedPE-SWsnd-G1]|nr:MAG: GNAT family N-acetyltransferase [Bacteroidetes bacterium MedPE-SWsnd-G1]